MFGELNLNSRVVIVTNGLKIYWIELREKNLSINIDAKVLTKNIHLLII